MSILYFDNGETQPFILDGIAPRNRFYFQSELNHQLAVKTYGLIELKLGRKAFRKFPIIYTY